MLTTRAAPGAAGISGRNAATRFWMIIFCAVLFDLPSTTWSVCSLSVFIVLYSSVIHRPERWRYPMPPCDPQPVRNNGDVMSGESLTSGVWTFSAGLGRLDRINPGGNGTDPPPGPHAHGR